MLSIAERMLGGTGGNAHHIEAVQGETITIISGESAGETYIADSAVESDFVIDSNLGMDPRAKRILRFRVGGNLPTLASQDILQTADGKRWHAVRRPGSAFLTVDYELKEIAAGLDT